MTIMDSESIRIARGEFFSFNSVLITLANYQTRLSVIEIRVSAEVVSMVWAFKKGAPLKRANRVVMMVFCIMV